MSKNELIERDKLLDQLTKYRHLFDLTKDALNGEMARFNQIEQKATRMFAALTILISFSPVLVNWVVKVAIPPEGCLEYFIIILTVAVIIFTIISWRYLLGVLKTTSLYHIRIDDKMIQFFDNNSHLDIYYALARQIKDIYRKNLAITNKKCILLGHGYKFLIYNLICSVLLLALSILLYWFGSY
ncbi:MAG: hypothetical protein H0Z29_10685 [Candidatus Marinimicrobia bacterium]|nr:hypothetical protein [Candidatus Neomarinimicrobiota bacterium]